MRGQPRQSINTNNIDIFEVIDENFKYYEDGKSFDDMQNQHILFEGSTVELEDHYNIELINDEINRISRKIFRFGMIVESQTQVLQFVEEEYNRWYAEKYIEVDQETDANGKSIKRTEKGKEYAIMVNWIDTYDMYTKRIMNEKRKLGIVKRALSSLEGYSYKLHSLQDYRKMALQKGV